MYSADYLDAELQLRGELFFFCFVLSSRVEYTVTLEVCVVYTPMHATTLIRSAYAHIPTQLHTGWALRALLGDSVSFERDVDGRRHLHGSALATKSGRGESSSGAKKNA